MKLTFLLDVLETEEPILYNTFVGTEAESVLNRELINADFILEQPLTNWHFLFDPTGINADANTFGLDDSIAGFVVSSWTMGESSIREGRQVERVFEAEVMADETYIVRSVQSTDTANLSSIGFGALDILDGVEIIGVTPTPPDDYMTTSTGGFPIMIIYGMAGMAALGGIGFFIISSRSMKNQAQGQQGIDPSNLVGYQTSASSGGYQTNRGEAQLKSDTDYEQSRNVYDESPKPTSTPEPTPQPEPEPTPQPEPTPDDSAKPKPTLPKGFEAKPAESKKETKAKAKPSKSKKETKSDKSPEESAKEDYAEKIGKQGGTLPKGFGKNSK